MKNWEEPELMILGVENTEKLNAIDEDDCPKCDCDLGQGVENDCLLDGKCECHDSQPTLS